MKFERGSTKKAREIASRWIKNTFPDYFDQLSIGLPEYDDRFDLWRIPLNAKNSNLKLIGEIKIDNTISKILEHTATDLVIERIEKWKDELSNDIPVRNKKNVFYPVPVPNKVVLGNCIDVLEEFPSDTAQLVITSPPYYNAKPEYSEYVDYQEYLDFIRRVVVRCHAILSEGRFFIINISPVLIKRTSRNTASKRIALPFDVHKIIESAGFDFVDDIIWVKPEGAGWNLGRGRRFAADRQPLQYKPVPVTEYILVYRKKTDKLIDWNIRNHYNDSLIEESKIQGEYDVTNIWKIHPSNNKIHPATFPEELVRRCVRYYSFKDDLVLDPFGGSGTVAKVAFEMKRRFLLIDNEPEYFSYMKETLTKILPTNIRVDYDIHENFK